MEAGRQRPPALPEAVRVRTGHDDNAGDTRNASVSDRTLLFALPILDTGDANTPDESSMWTYALDVSGK